MAVEDIIEFSNSLQENLMKKQNWYNTKGLPAVLENFRLLHTCTKNLYELLVSKSLIVPDVYHTNQKIAGVTSPSTSNFTDNEAPMAIGTRFSEYETMLDYICTYVHFSVESLDMATIKRLIEFLQSFTWSDYSPTSLKPNIRGLAMCLSQAKSNAPQITLSLISDSVEKCKGAAESITRQLNELGRFQREMYKGCLRKDLFEHPNFNKEIAFSSPENEMTEIRKLFPLVMGKANFYPELVNEIINEDQGSNAKALRADLEKKLHVNESAIKSEKQAGNDHRAELLDSVNVLGALGPIYQTIYRKINLNFSLMKEQKKGLGASIGAFFKRLFKIKEKEQVYAMLVTDPTTHEKVTRSFRVAEVTSKIEHTKDLLSDIAAKGAFYKSLVAKRSEDILSFLDKEIAECRGQYNLMMGLEIFFQNEIPAAKKANMRGFKLELDSVRATIINANAKKAEYQEVVEEERQLQKLGLTDEE